MFCIVPRIDEATPAIRGNGSSARTVALAMTIAIENMKAQTLLHSHANPTKVGMDLLSLARALFQQGK